MSKDQFSFLQSIANPHGLEEAIPLRRGAGVEFVQDQFEVWSDAVEDVVQEAIRNIRVRSEDNIYKSGIRDLESTCFCQSLMTLKKRWGDRFPGKSIPHEVEIFSNPVGLVSFQVHDRKYSCIKYPTEDNSKPNSQKYLDAIRETEKYFSSYRVDIENVPSTEELVSILLDHLAEEMDEDQDRFLTIGNHVLGDVLRPRKSAILDWQYRLEQWYTEKFIHKNDRFYFYSYPIVDLLIKDGKYLLLLFVSPLDLNFVDEKVSDIDQCSEMTIGIFNVENLNYQRVIQSVGSQLKQAYGRVLFTNMHEEATKALMATFDDQSRILHHWVRMASKGYEGLIDEGISKGIFDSTEFIKSIVKKVLCAEIPNVETELYPFDRAFIFREAGSSTAKSLKEPLEVTIMEAATLSKNPADRNQHLTARERKIRTTQDYERDASQKIIKDENVFTFYLHNHGNEIIFTQKPKLSKDDKESLQMDQASSRSKSTASQKLYKIKTGETETYNEISGVFSNLIGRLLEKNTIKKITKTVLTHTKFTTTTFTEEFEKERQKTTEKFDPRGLYYAYDHGIYLPEATPMLSSMQDAYFDFLKAHFTERDEHHRRDKYRQDNLSETQLDKTIDEEISLERKQQREGLQSGEMDHAKEDRSDNRQKSKVVYIAFSWELHDENMEIYKRNLSPAGETLDALLDEAFTYTLILVSDLDPEKSISELNSQRENLRLFFQLIMERIWMDRKIELEKLYNRSKMIADSLTQFAHRAKNFITDESHKDYLDNEIKKLQSLTQAKGTTAQLIKLNKPEEFFRRVLKLNKKTEVTPTFIEGHIRSWLSAVMSNSSRDINRLKIKVDYRSIPELRVRWSDPIIKEAVDNAAKNAAEAALDNTDPASEPELNIQLQTYPRSGQNQTEWFLEILFENTGGPIPEKTLKKLNAPNPQPMGSNPKEGSTGLGVFLSRFQLINDIGGGADLIYSNLENGNVQVRLRLPCSTFKESTEQEEVTVQRQSTGLTDYILYVEDYEFERAFHNLQSAFEGSGLDVVHKKSLLGAKEVVNLKIPTAIFSDYNIYKDEDEATASQKFGLELIKHLLTSARDAGINPPIWMISAEKESGILKKLKEEGLDLGSYGYKLIPGIEKYTPEITQPGAFLVLPKHKDPTTLPGFDQIIADLTHNEQKTIDQPEEKALSTVEFDVSTAGFKALKSAYSGSPDSTIFYSRQAVSDINQLFETLQAWFHGPSLPDPDLPDSDVKPIYHHFNHDRVLLHLALDPSIYEQVPLELVYWGLTYNFLLTSQDFDTEKAISGWRTLIHGDKGPISTFRHDMKNTYHEEKYEKIRQKLQDELDHAEKVLKNSLYDLPKLESTLLSRQKVSKIIPEYLSQSQANTDLISQLNKITEEIQITLGEVKEISGEKIESGRSFQQITYYLREFLGVN